MRDAREGPLAEQLINAGSLEKIKDREMYQIHAEAHLSEEGDKAIDQYPDRITCQQDGEDAEQQCKRDMRSANLVRRNIRCQASSGAPGGVRPPITDQEAAPQPRW